MSKPTSRKPIVSADGVKVSKFSLADREYVKQNWQTQTVEQMAHALNRRPSAVHEYVERYSGESSSVEDRVAFQIKNTPIWDDLKQQFTKIELNMFIYHWKRIVSQFKEDIFPTEELQIVDMIRLELLSSRMLNQQQHNLIKINEMEMEILKMREDGAPAREISDTNRRVQELRASQEIYKRSYDTMIDKKMKIMKDMKATRDQRVKVLDESKKNFSVWMRRLLEDSTLRKAFGESMEKMRLASTAEYERLSDYHEYADKVVDQPFLTPETVKDD